MALRRVALVDDDDQLQSAISLQPRRADKHCKVFPPQLHSLDKACFSMMSKRTVFTTVTPLPAGISRQTVLETLWNHIEMIDLNPVVEKREPVKPPPEATPEEFNCIWYRITDKINFLPGGLYSSNVVFHTGFHDLPDGLQTHVYAPMGLDIKGRWTLGGSLPGEPRQPTELGLGLPKEGLWLREDIDMRCNIFATTFVKKNLKDAHGVLVQRLIEKSHLTEAVKYNQAIGAMSPAPAWSSPVTPGPANYTVYNPSIAQQYPYTPGQTGQYSKEPYPSGQVPPYTEGAQHHSKPAELE